MGGVTYTLCAACLAIAPTSQWWPYVEAARLLDADGPPTYLRCPACDHDTPMGELMQGEHLAVVRARVGLVRRPPAAL